MHSLDTQGDSPSSLFFLACFFHLCSLQDVQGMVVAGHRGLATGLAGLEKAVTGLGRRKRGEEGARAAEQEARSKLSENYELIAKVRI